MSKKVVVIGAGGHAKVIADIIENSGDKIIGFLDDNKEKGTKILGYNILGKIDEAYEMRGKYYYIVALGDNYKRKQISEKYNLKLYTAIHPTAVIGKNVTIGNGTVVMANVCINSDTCIGENCIINTGAIIEHDNKISDYVHISPNATLAGTVSIGEFTHIGISATVKNNITITSNCVIGAGAVVVKNIEESGTYVGVPVRKIK